MTLCCDTATREERDHRRRDAPAQRRGGEDGGLVEDRHRVRTSLVSPLPRMHTYLLDHVSIGQLA